MKPASCLFLCLLSSCTQDYRTDYEVNNGIELTQEAIEFRREYNSETLRLQQVADEEYWFREALEHCSAQPIAACL